MKKKVLGLMMAFLAAAPVFVNAEETFEECLAGTGSKTCTLTENVELASTIEVKGNIILDLAGYEITSDATTAIKVISGNLTVKDTSTESKGKIEVSGEAFRVGTKGVADDNKDSSILTIEKGVDVTSTNDACVVIYAGTLNTAGNLTTEAGHFATVQGSGNDHGTVINVTGGLIRNNVQVAIFQPQNGTLTISGGTVTGTTGVEVRAGKLTVNGGTIIGNINNTSEVTVAANGSGSTTAGVGIAVAQHTTILPIEVIVNDGTIKGLVALYESNPQKNSADDIAKVKITVKGGILETTKEGNDVIFSENNLVTVEAGEFNGEISSDLAVEETKIYEVVTTEGENKYIVTEESKVEEGYFGLGFERETLEAIDNEELKETLNLVDKALADKYTAAIYYEIVYGDLIDNKFVLGTEVSELDEAIEITLDIPETIEKVKEGYTRNYKVIRVHYNEATKEFESDVLDVKSVKDGKVTFETNKFSTYVLAYEDTLATSNPKTFDGISLYMIIASVSLIGLVALVGYAKKAKSC